MEGRGQGGMVGRDGGDDWIEELRRILQGDERVEEESSRGEGGQVGMEGWDGG